MVIERCKGPTLTRKRVASRSDLFRPRKCLKRKRSRGGGGGEVDRVSELPDGILVHILSYMNCKEAARTSVLSRRWKEVWMYTPTLDFDFMGDYMKLRPEYSLIPGEAAKYVECVNRVLRVCKAGQLTTVFKVRFDVRICHQGCIDDWVKFACSKQHLEKLDLSLLDARWYVRNEPESCIFPNPLTLALGGFRSLKELCLKSVNVNDDVLAYFMENCQLLERLIVHYSHHLRRLQVYGTHLKLKHLELVFCLGLELVRVSETNLASLVFKTAGELQLHNVPMLVRVTYCRMLEEPIESVFSCLSCCLFSQLEMLHWSVSYLKIRKMETQKIPQLTKVKKLVIYSDPRRDFSLIGVTSLLMASPNLQSFVMELSWCTPDRRSRKWKEALESPLRHLKEVAVCGYYGCTSEVELLAYILRNSIALEKITIDPRKRINTPLPISAQKLEEEEPELCLAKHYAEMQLREITSAHPHVNLFIL